MLDILKRVSIKQVLKFWKAYAFWIYMVYAVVISPISHCYVFICENLYLFMSIHLIVKPSICPRFASLFVWC